MRIIHIVHGKVNPNGPNGISRVVYFMNLYEKKEGEKSEIWAFVDGIKEHYTFKRDENVTVEIYPRLHFFSMNHPIIKRFKQERDSIDIVHFHMIWFLDKNILSRNLENLKIPYVVTTHGTYSVPQSYKGKKKIARFLYEVQFLNRAHAIHALTPEEKSALIQYGVTKPIFTVPNGVEKSQIPEDHNSDFYKSNITNNKIKIAWVGVLRQDKNLDLLIKCMPFLPKSIQRSILFIIIGPDYKGSKTKLEELACSLGFSDSFLFTGPLYGKDKYDALNSSDIYIMPSSSEGVSLSILDAMAMSKPCILTRGCNMTYYYDRGFYEMCECLPDEIARAIIRLINKKELWGKMGENGKNLINEVFGWDAIVKSLITKYQEIVLNAK